MALKTKDNLHDKFNEVKETKNSNKMVQQPFLFPKEDWEVFKQHCKIKHLSASAEVRRLVYDFMQKENLLKSSI